MGQFICTGLVAASYADYNVHFDLWVQQYTDYVDNSIVEPTGGWPASKGQSLAWVVLVALAIPLMPIIFALLYGSTRPQLDLLRNLCRGIRNKTPIRGAATTRTTGTGTTGTASPSATDGPTGSLSGQSTRDPETTMSLGMD